MRNIKPSVFRVFIGIVALISIVSLISCASTGSHVSGQLAATGVVGDYVALLGKEPPFHLDLEGTRPFSRWNVPWNDEEVVGLDIVWLKCPTGYSSLPQFALVVNEYTKSDGLVCLVDKTGKVHASIRNLGSIQRLRAAHIAPIREPQLLVYTNPGHATGAFAGEAVLLAIAGQKSRVLLRIPRYEAFSLEGENYSFGLPILTSNTVAGARIAFLLFRFALREQSADATESPATRAEWDFSEYEWDRAQGVFLPARRPVSRCLFSPEAWTWSPQYDLGREGYVPTNDRATSPSGPHGAAR